MDDARRVAEVLLKRLKSLAAEADARDSEIAKLRIQNEQIEPAKTELLLMMGGEKVQPADEELLDGFLRLAADAMNSGEDKPPQVRNDLDRRTAEILERVKQGSTLQTA